MWDFRSSVLIARLQKIPVLQSYWFWMLRPLLYGAKHKLLVVTWTRNLWSSLCNMNHVIYVMLHNSDQCFELFDRPIRLDKAERVVQWNAENGIHASVSLTVAYRHPASARTMCHTRGDTVYGNEQNWAIQWANERLHNTAILCFVSIPRRQLPSDRSAANGYCIPSALPVFYDIYLGRLKVE